MIMGLERGFCSCLLSFLCIDFDGLLGFQLNPDVIVQLRKTVNQHIPTNILKSEKLEVFTRFMHGDKSKFKELYTKIGNISVKATVLPLSALTNLFHQRFSKHRYLELTLEILQQFYISMEI